MTLFSWLVTQLTVWGILPWYNIYLGLDHKICSPIIHPEIWNRDCFVDVWNATESFSYYSVKCYHNQEFLSEMDLFTIRVVLFSKVGGRSINVLKSAWKIFLAFVSPSQLTTQATYAPDSFTIAVLLRRHLVIQFLKCFIHSQIVCFPSIPTTIVSVNPDRLLRFCIDKIFHRSLGFPCRWIIDCWRWRKNIKNKWFCDFTTDGFDSFDISHYR